MLKKTNTGKIHKGLCLNSGSTLITVIVAIAFVTILTSIILGTTLVNVRMKGIDRRTHDDFYYAEKSLNDIYIGLGQDLAELAGKEYETAFKKLGTSEGVDDYNKAETAESIFKQEYIEKAYKLIDNLDGSENGKVTKAALNEYVLDTSKGEVENKTDIVIEYQDKNGVKTTVVADRYRVALKSVEVSVEDTLGYRSTVTTDIIINVPTVDFLGTNVDVSDYGLIANKGLYINATSGPVTINGNVYAGTHGTANSEDTDFDERTDAYSRSTPVYGGINIKNGRVVFNGNYIISKGDINLTGSNPGLDVNSSPTGSDSNLANLWFTSLRVLSDAEIDPIPTPTPTPSPTPTGTPVPTPIPNPTININANTFALNDLVLNADNSSAVINGNYYGYNDGGVVGILGKKSGREDAENSAVIINGSRAYLYMRDIDNFVLMGKAYVDFTSDSQTKADATSEQVVPTAESVALKTNQQLYLVPPDFLEQPNPMMDTVGTNFTLSISSTDYKNWFGHKYLRNYKLPFNSTEEKDDKYTHTKYTVKLKDGTSIYYDYLNFDEKKSWLPIKDSDDKIIGYKPNLKDGVADTPENRENPEKYKEIGTGGSISSKAAFFFEIMNANTSDDDVEASLVQPSAYRLNQRIKLSMENSEYFDLKLCAVGKSADDANYYAKNAVINYIRGYDNKIQSNVFNNTVGMDRYISYAQNLFYRYVWLCTRLDGKEKILLNGDPGTPDLVSASTEWKIDSPAPISHFVILPTNPMNLSTSSFYSNAAGLKPGAYGACVATKSNLTIGSGLKYGLVGTTFKGIAIVDGDITVEEGYGVDGLLMATGTITLGGNNTINYNKGLIQSRIEKELNKIKSTDPSVTPTPIPEAPAGTTDPKDYYLINYLAAEDPSSHTMKPIYKADEGSKIKKDRIEADYNEFMHYENWQKGEK